MVATGNHGHNAALTPGTVAALLERCHAELQRGGVYFGHGTDNAWDEAVALVLGVLGLPPESGEEVLGRRVPAAAADRVQALLARRLAGEPLPYLLGTAWFAGLEFRCDHRALVPRSPLAEVIGNAFRPWWAGAPPRRILDLCCGGGCIGIAAARYQPQASVVLADLDAQALELARENIALHGVAERARAVRSDLFQGLRAERFDIILCNPPYVNRQDIDDMPREYRAEPLHALAAGEDGLDLALQILAAAPAWLVERGVLFLELGNSWAALDALCGDLALTWLDFADGGHGVLAATREELGAAQGLFTGLAAARGAGSP